MGTTLNAATTTNDTFTITSNDQLVRADNTEMAWSGSNWVPGVFVDGSTRFFGGHFGAPSSSTAQNPYGDYLLGALAPSGGNNGSPTITFSFSQTLSYIAFQVSSASNPDFIADLIAFNSLGQKLGTYQVSDTGGGGNCPGLSKNPPQPCNDAALIQFYDPGNAISSVELVMLNDPSGVYIDGLDVAVPEPSSLVLFAAGILLLGFGAKSVSRELPFARFLSRIIPAVLFR